MKSNKVRMNISREMHEWFKSQCGKDNDEKMKLLRESRLLLKSQNSIASRFYEQLSIDNSKLVKENLNLKFMLGISAVASNVSIGYLAYVQGWFL